MTEACSQALHCIPCFVCFYIQTGCLVHSLIQSEEFSLFCLFIDFFAFIMQFLDHLLTGIEDICGHYGHHHWKDKYGFH